MSFYLLVSTIYITENTKGGGSHQMLERSITFYAFSIAFNVAPVCSTTFQDVLQASITFHHTVTSCHTLWHSITFCDLPSPSKTFHRVPGCSTEFYHTMKDSCVLVDPCGSLHALSVIIFGVVVMWLCVVLSSLSVALCGHVDKLVCVSTCMRVGYNVVWVLGWSGDYIIILQMLQIFTMLSACSTVHVVDQYFLDNVWEGTLYVKEDRSDLLLPPLFFDCVC